MSDQVVSMDISSDDKLWALLSYLLSPIVPLIILLMEDKKNRPFLRYHAIQALVWVVVVSILSFVVIGCCLGPIGSIYFGIMAYQGQYVIIPFLTDFCKQQKWLS